MKQTAVEWLVKQLEGVYESDYLNKLVEQAKEMEKEQIIEAYNTSFLLRDKPYSTAEKYYEQTFNKSINDKG